MSFPAIVLLALGLAMDAAAVSAARGIATPRIAMRHIALVAAFFGGFQALMPMIGWVLGARLGPYIQAWDHWIAFALLGGIGGKMLWEAREDDDGESPVGAEAELYGLRVMLLLAVATSIDALAVGVTLPMLNAPFLTSMLTIGLTTATLSVAALFAGKRFGHLLGKRMDVVGGLVLIALGAKILFEHLHAA